MEDGELGVGDEGGKLVAIREGQRVGMAMGFLQEHRPVLCRGPSMETGWYPFKLLSP